MCTQRRHDVVFERRWLTKLIRQMHFSLAARAMTAFKLRSLTYRKQRSLRDRPHLLHSSGAESGAGPIGCTAMPTFFHIWKMVSVRDHTVSSCTPFSFSSPSACPSTDIRSPYRSTAIEAALAFTLLCLRTWVSSCSMYSSGRFAEVAVWFEWVSLPLPLMVYDRLTLSLNTRMFECSMKYLSMSSSVRPAVSG